MSLICLDCGNTEEFKKIAPYKEWVEETQFVDGKSEDVLRVGKSDTTGSEQMKILMTSCEKCHSENVEEGIDEIDVLKIQVEHTDDKDKWHEDELEEDEQNKKLKKKLIEMKI